MTMAALPPQQPSDKSDFKPTGRSIIGEALAKQAALRPLKSPPKLIATPPTLPKVRKHRRRRRTV